MNNSRMRSGGGGGGGQRRIPIKDRVGAAKRPVKAKGKLQVKLASRLGLPIKARLGVGGGKVAGGKITKGKKILDAREKIILNRVSKGRAGMDARAKIEAKRMTKKVLGGGPGLKTNASKAKSLRITTSLGGGGAPGPLMTTSGRFRAGAFNNRVGGGGGGGPRSEGFFANEPQQQLNPRQLRISVPSMGMRGGRGGMPMTMRADENLFLTRTVTNFSANVPSTSAANSRQWHSSVAKVAPSFSRGGYGMDDVDMEDDSPPRLRMSSNLQSRLDTQEEAEAPTRYKLIVSNLQPTVTTEDIVELFSDINVPISARITTAGHAEVVYNKKNDCLKAVDAYHNRLLDGSPMRVVLENNSTTLKSAGGATMKLPKASSSVKIQPDISAIHKVLFNPSSGNSTRGLFKGGQ